MWIIRNTKRTQLLFSVEAVLKQWDCVDETLMKGWNCHTQFHTAHKKLSSLVERAHAIPVRSWDSCQSKLIFVYVFHKTLLLTDIFIKSRCYTAVQTVLTVTSISLVTMSEGWTLRSYIGFSKVARPFVFSWPVNPLNGTFGLFLKNTIKYQATYKSTQIAFSV